MLNVLITGSNGFIGKNMISNLDTNHVNILKFTRENNVDNLEKLILKSDFIYHFAGEVKPDSSNEEFRSSNITLTKTIVEILESNNKKIPILLTSSIHAKLLKNEYGKTKRASELIIEKYSISNDVKCFIYRLPHVFGEDCKPNYNSVITTWIYNSINNIEIKVFDRNIKMNYIYVQDLVSELIYKLNDNDSEIYIELKKNYDTTLGEIVDYINEFKENINTYKIGKNEFKNKLYQTYMSYCK